jgi:protein ImuB
MDLKGLGLNTSAALQTRMEHITQALARFHLDSRIGVAPTPALALLTARAANPIAIVQDPRDFFAALPVAGLEPPQHILDLLNRWGVRAIGGLLALGRDNVAARLGPEALALFDRVAPDAIRPLQVVSPPQEFSEQMEFENEIDTAAPLLFVLRRFVEQLSRRLEAVYLVVGEFQLRLGLASGAAHERVFKIPSPTGKVDTLFRVLQTHLETVRTDSPIISLRLAARPAVPEQQQFGLFESVLRDPNQFAETLARLGALLEPENAGTPVLSSTHKPDSFRMRPPEFNQPPPQTLERSRADIHKAGLRMRRLRPPAPAHFEFRDKTPALMRSDLFTGPITGARGPFFSSGQWWDDARWAREEWDVATANGSFLRIFRSNDGCFVEGVYD